jgi:hypothetical protein
MMREPDLYQLFHASPGIFFEELSKKIKGLDERIDRLTSRIEDLAEAMETYVRQDLPLARARPDVTAWTYDALMPNVAFDSVFEPEIMAGGAKRWVKAAASGLRATLALPRNHQFNFQVQVIDFVSPEAEASFLLKADGVVCPWLSQHDRLYSAVIPARPEGVTLDFALETDPAASGDRDVCFSFRTIRIHANQSPPPS